MKYLGSYLSNKDISTKENDISLNSPAFTGNPTVNGDSIATESDVINTIQDSFNFIYYNSDAYNLLDVIETQGYAVGELPSGTYFFNSLSPQDVANDIPLTYGQNYSVGALTGILFAYRDTTYTIQLLLSSDNNNQIGHLWYRGFSNISYQEGTTPWFEIGLDSPNFSGVPTAPTASSNVSNGQIATTSFVHNVVNSDRKVIRSSFRIELLPTQWTLIDQYQPDSVPYEGFYRASYSMLINYPITSINQVDAFVSPSMGDFTVPITNVEDYTKNKVMLRNIEYTGSNLILYFIAEKAPSSSTYIDTSVIYYAN